MAHEAEKKTLTAGMMKFAGSYVAGGALTSVFTRQKINDYDVYFKSAEAFRDAIEAAYDTGLWCVDVSKRAVTFVCDDTVYQLMHFGFFPEASDIFSSFDFTCCMGAYDVDADAMVLHDDFLTHCSQRFLRFNPGTRFPLASAVRVLKYQDRGYSIGKGDVLRIALACRGVTINSWDDLKDQIGGAYGNKIMLAADGEFSNEAAIAALAPDEIWTAAPAEEQPAYAEQMFERLTSLTGLAIPQHQDEAA
ncbi:hypothetical protein [Brevundimonas nasdae]|uniref:hypothetical protein n=1 Tax=Brevundimonas nasdae TaxID=172043 RepID=UPI00289E4F67|nr:hypothetical protein [Brevundimonas nasdae]